MNEQTLALIERLLDMTAAGGDTAFWLILIHLALSPTLWFLGLVIIAVIAAVVTRKAIQLGHDTDEAFKFRSEAMKAIASYGYPTESEHHFIMDTLRNAHEKARRS